MKSREEFKVFYRSTLLPKLKQLESQRKKLAFNILIVAALLAVITLGLYLAKQTWAPFVTIVAYLAIHFFFFNTPLKKYTEEFKKEIIKHLVKFFDESLSYSPEGSITETEYRESQLFLTGVDRYFGDDFVSGKLDKTSLKFSEVHTEYKTESTDSKGNRQTHWHTIFRGIFLIADFNKNFSGKTFVLPDVAESMFGSFFGNALQKLDSGRGELVKMEDVEFEKLFCVHSSNQIEARYILSPKLMERIVQFKKKSGKTIHLSFINSKLFIALSIHKELFEPSLFTSLLNPILIEEFFDYLYLAISIVEEMDLNNRIWTKE